MSGLDNCEKDLLTNLLRRDAVAVTSEQISKSLISWRQIQRVFLDCRMYLYAIVMIGDLGAIMPLMTSLPLMMQDLGYSTAVAHLMTIVPYIVSCLVIILGGFLASRLKEYSIHHGLLAFISLCGCVLMIGLENQGKIAVYISICIACCGAFSSFSIFWCWFLSNVGGNTKRTVAVGVISGIGQVGGIIHSQVSEKCSYNTASPLQIHLASCSLLSI